MFKKRYLFLIIIICLLAISAVSAEDNSTSDIVSVSNDVNSLEANCNMNSIANDTDTLKVSNEEVLTAGNNWYVNASKTSSGNGKSEITAFNSLNKALTVAEDDDTIIIASGTYTGENNTNLTINKNLKFIKYGDDKSIFDAEGLSRIWTVTATSINITGLTFKNGKAYGRNYETNPDNCGGAIYFNSNGNINNCSFIDCSSGYYGGAIYFTGSGNVNNCSFIDCSSSYYGGAIYFNSYGNVNNCSFIDCSSSDYSYASGAIYFNISGNVNNCSFVNCSSYEYGGAISFVNSDGNVFNCSFMNCSSDSSGGAISFWASDGNVFNCSFMNCSSDSGGGAIFLNKGNISNCSFMNCSSSKYGGAISINSGNVLNCSFVNCSSITANAIHFNSIGIVFDCTFVNCSPGSSAIYFKNNGSVVNCSFVNCSSNYYGGAIYLNTGNVLNCSFMNCSSSNYGGAISFWGSDGNVANCSFVNCNSSSYSSSRSYGGAIFFKNNGGVFDCNFVNCTSSSTSNQGGAIYCGKNSNVTNCSFVNCSSSSSSISYGGAIYGSNVVNCSFVNCSSSSSSISYGGAIYGSNVVNCSFVNCNSSNYGGAISGSNVVNCSFVNCSSNSRGGAIYGSNVVNCSFVNCNSTDYGGAISCSGHGNIVNCSFINNNAIHGGAISCSGENNIVNCIFMYCNAKFGGAIYFNVGIPELSVIYCAFVNNTASYGKAIYSYTKSVSINDNWWGSNNPDWSSFVHGLGMPSSFAVLNVTANSQRILPNSTVMLYYAFYKNKTNNVLSIPVRTIELSSDGGQLDNISGYLVNGEFSTEFSSNTEGIYTIIAKLDNEKITTRIHVNSSAPIPTNITVNPTSLDLNVGETGSINATLNPHKAGNLTFTSKDTNIATVDSNGVVIAVAEGSAIITVSFSGNEQYAPAESKKIIVTVKLRDACVTVNNNTLNLTADDTFKLISTTVPTGLKVTYKSRDKSIATVDANGKVTAKSKGIVIITVSVGGDGIYALNSTTVSVTVHEKPIPPKENLTISASAEPIIVGDDANVVVTGLKDATGEVTVTIGSTILTGKINKGTANVIITDLKETTTAIVNYPGDSKYNSASTTVKITVNPKPKENLTISASAKPITVGENTNVIVTGLKDATGEVMVTVNGKTYTGSIRNGGATVTIPGLTETVTANVNYPGDKQYNSASTTVKITVNPKPKENLTISASAKPITVGENTNVIVTGLKDATGEISVIVNGKKYTSPIRGGEASVTISGLTESVTANVNYPGDSKYNSASTTVKITVNPNVIIYAPDVTKDYGGPERLEITLTESGSPVANADVNININGADYTRMTDANGKASLGLNLNAGSYDATVTYKDISTKAKVVINKLTTKNTLSYAKNSHNSVTLTSLIDSPTASGNAVFTVNGKDYSAKVNGGKATYTLNNLAVGSYSAVAKYKGDVNHKESSSNSVKFTVEDVKIEVSAPDLTKYYNGPERFVVTVKEDYKAVVGKNVTINLNGRSYIRTTDSDGQASMAINLNSGKYNVTTEYNGIKVYSTVTIKDTVISKDFTKIFRNNTQYYATFVDSQGNVLKNTPVRLNINGVYYTRTTNDQGIAKMNINLNPGTYILTAENPASGEQHTTRITVLPSIVENHDLTKYYRNESKYTLRILDGNGKPVNAGVTVKLNINGVFYERKTNASGYINMNINLIPGTYIVTAEYNGLRASNTVKVLPILSAKDVNMKYRDGTKFEAKLLNGKGNPFANQKITFNINGVFYERITDSNGIARLNINLMAGEYIITSMYENGAALSNKVTISS